MVTRSKENSNISGNKLASVKILTHDSNEPTLSSTEVKFLSNPTVMTTEEQMEVISYHKVLINVSGAYYHHHQ